jgi:hypothetical protein
MTTPVPHTPDEKILPKLQGYIGKDELEGYKYKTQH